MKLSELNKKRSLVDELLEERKEEAKRENEEPQGTTCVTPSGIEIAYEWAPRRLYRLNGVEVPSVTTVLGVLDKSGALTWWGQNVGVAGTMTLWRENEIVRSTPEEEVVKLLTEHKLTVNHVKDKAADRGVNVHSHLEEWCKSGALPDSNESPEHERGYVQGLYEFLCAIVYVEKEARQELMVGSLQHQYAGRFDLVLTLSRPVEVVTRCYPKRPPKIEEIPAGRYLLDLKTSKRVYDTHYLQLEAYEAAAVECGYAPTDHRGVVHVTADGKYELALNRDWTFEDFLAVRQCYRVMNERQIVQTFLDELDAAEVKS